MPAKSKLDPPDTTLPNQTMPAVPLRARTRGTKPRLACLTATYLNRLSDLLFILARHANLAAGGDVLWQPGATRA